MNASWDPQWLLNPIAVDKPCGDNPDESFLLAPFDSLRLFRQDRSPEAPPEPDDEEGKERGKAKAAPNWDDLKSDASTALGRSKDLRLLTYLAAAVLRTDGLPAFVQTLGVAATWLETYWPNVYPVIDEDALERCSALNCFADLMLFCDRVWRLPLVESPRHGRFSLRDLEIAAGHTQPGADERRPEEGAVTAAFDETALEQLIALQAVANEGIANIKRINAVMLSQGGTDMVPDLAGLSKHFGKISTFLRTRIESRQGGDASVASDSSGSGVSDAPLASAGGPIRSRQDAIRALDAVAEFFRKNEPSSPVPLFTERAKRLVSVNFLEALADIVPDAVSAARAAGGVKDESAS